jgi:hypothetical protein
MRSIVAAISGLLIAAGLAAFAAADAPGGGELVRGRVTSGGEPVPGAMVRFQAHGEAVVADAAGSFALPVTVAVLAIASELGGELRITAAKEGFYNQRRRYRGDGAEVIFDLLPIPADHGDYPWQDPTPDPASETSCGNCHSDFYAQWLGDAHSRSAVNPLVTTLYNGTDVDGRPAGAGYRGDWPDFGPCADCHAPAAAANDKLDLNLLHGVEKLGVSCDFCHKIREVRLNPRFASSAELVVSRPQGDAKLVFGPFDDAIFPGDVPDFSFAPWFSDSRVCAPCHDGSFMGVPVYATFSEWRQSAYAARGTQCQDCHMRPAGLSRFADEEDGGLLRDAADISSHRTMGPDPEALLRSAVTMETEAEARGRNLAVTVTITNSGAGHHLPTGQPLRHMLLVVSARDARGEPLRMLFGERVPSWGGDLAGRIGKGFAKVLLAASEYNRSNVLVQGDTKGDFPAPFWRRPKILTDNRIPAEASDTSQFLFRLPEENAAVEVRAELIYRRAYQDLAEIKGWELLDVLLAADTVQLDHAGEPLAAAAAAEAHSAGGEKVRR